MKSKIKEKHLSKLFAYSRKLRKYATPTERELYKILKKLPYSLWFQKVIPPYIADFLIRNVLIIELDGKYHESQIERDSYRDNYLKRYGFEILRFSNDEFNNNREEVLNLIIKTVKSISKDRVLRGKKRTNRVIRDYKTNWTLFGAGEFRHKNYDFDIMYGFKRRFAGELSSELQKIL